MIRIQSSGYVLLVLHTVQICALYVNNLNVVPAMTKTVITKSKENKRQLMSLTNQGVLPILTLYLTPKDTVANDLKHHQCCWVYAQRETQRKGQCTSHVALKEENTSRVITNMEIS